MTVTIYKTRKWKITTTRDRNGKILKVELEPMMP